jgi:hypothetical protein
MSDLYGSPPQEVIVGRLETKNRRLEGLLRQLLQHRLYLFDYEFNDDEAEQFVAAVEAEIGPVDQVSRTFVGAQVEITFRTCPKCHKTRTFYANGGRDPHEQCMVCLGRVFDQECVLDTEVKYGVS